VCVKKWKDELLLSFGVLPKEERFESTFIGGGVIMCQKLCMLVCLVLLVSILSPVVQAADVTFTGFFGDAWGDPTNWDGFSTPTTDDKAYIPAGLACVSSEAGNVAGGTWVAGGTLDVTSGDLTTGVSVADGGTFTVAGGSYTSGWASLGISPSSDVFVGSKADMRISGGTVTIGATGLNIGIIAGSDATLTISGSAATIQINGNVDGWSGLIGGKSTVLFEIDAGGISPINSTSYISLNSATVGVSAIGGYVPAGGDSFILGNSATMVDIANLINLTPEWTISVVDKSLVATYIPEPATLCLLGLGALVLRRKK